MAFLARHPAAVGVLATALAATAVVFGFFRPEYRPTGEDSLVKVNMSRYPASSDGWAWAGGQPGFRFGEHEEEWNFSGVQGGELAPARAAARRWGIAPASVRLLEAIRLGPGDLNMVVAGTNAADETCLGVVQHDGPADYYCPDRLRSQSALLMLTRGDPLHANGLTYEPAWVTGIERSDVRRITVDQPPDWNEVGVFDRPSGHSYWGTWELSLGPAPDVVVTVYLRDGRVHRAAVDLTRPGDRVITIPG
jgi:hypothetical protein